MADLYFDVKSVPVITPEEIQEWQALKIEIAAKTAKERLLRDKIAKAYFHDPKEGTNKNELGEGWTIKLTHKLTRDVDVAMLTVLAPKLRSMGVNIDTIIEAKPVLKVAAYRKLDAEALKVFDQCITVKAGSPTIEIVPPKDV